MLPEGQTSTFDGVGMMWRGDVMLIVYQQAARLHRTRWLFDQCDEVCANLPGGLMALMVVLPSADPPDSATRTENNARLKKLGIKLRRLVTVPVGDAFRMSLVRAVMRAISVIQGTTHVQFVCNTIDDGMRVMLVGSSQITPPGAQLFDDLVRVHKALGVEMPRSAGGTRVSMGLGMTL
jgi:hypothetical protein